MSAVQPSGVPGLRVAVVPFSDPYVDAVTPPGVERVGPAHDPSRWLDPAYLAAHAGLVDLVHVHTGYGHLPEDEMVSWAETVRRTGVPLVTTVHQLRDPAQASRRRHDAHLAALLATAEVVLTLTRGAADEIAARFGRTAIVVAHPSVAVPVAGVGAERGLVGLALGPAEPAVPDPVGLLRAAVSGARNGGGRLRLFLGPGAEPPRSEGPRWEGPRWEGPRGEELRWEGLQDGLEVVPRREEDWVAQLQELHVAVLPQSSGTHSRDLEICRDVGTRVVAPSCGWFADQWSDVVTYTNDEEGGLDPVSLDVAISAALARPAPAPADRGWRAEQLAAVRAVHEQVYVQVAADRRGRGTAGPRG